MSCLSISISYLIRIIHVTTQWNWMLIVLDWNVGKNCFVANRRFDLRSNKLMEIVVSTTSHGSYTLWLVHSVVIRKLYIRMNFVFFFCRFWCLKFRQCESKSCLPYFFCCTMCWILLIWTKLFMFYFFFMLGSCSSSERRKLWTYTN